MTRFLFLAGKGGVGKTTCAIAAAGESARRTRTLLVSTDPAHSLSDALQVKLGAAPRQVRGKLFAAELDADRALSRWLGQRERAFREIASRGTYLDDEDIDALFRLSLPGVDELVALIELTRLSTGFDQVVVDTAPTGHTLRLLEMPQTLSRLAGVLDDLQAKHRALIASLRGVARRDAEDAVIEELQSRARELHALVRSFDVEFHWVTLPEELSLAETIDGVGALRAAGMRVTRLIINRLTPAPVGTCALCSARRAEEARVVRQAAGLGLPTEKVLAKNPGHNTDFRRIRPGSVVCPGLSPVELAPAGMRVLFFGGKGGVGKTTVAATAAIALAGSGRRVLLLSTDPAHSVGDALRMEIGDHERDVLPGLRARELDAPATFRSQRDRYRASVDELFERLRGGVQVDAPYDRAVMQDLIDLAPPGLDEIFALLAVIEALPRYDLVLVDTAPTGHALRLLELVPKAREWLQVLLEILLKYRKVTGLGRLAEDVTTTARELREFDQLLRDPARAGFVAVTRADALPRLETGRLLSALARMRIAVPALVVNGLTPPGCKRCKRAAAAEAAETARLRKARRGWVMLGIPATAPAPRGLDALRRLGETWSRME